MPFMRCRIPLAICVLYAGFLFFPVSGLSQTVTASTKKILSQDKAGFNVNAIEVLLNKGDRAASRGNLGEAREFYDDARRGAKELLRFYRDLSGAFRGLDARIPREMDSKGRESLVLLSKTNLRLAALFRRQKQPEIAVPLLVEVVKLMTPTKPEGQKAYQGLLELGFAETPYSASNLRSFE